jgi:hypothetical protein
MTSTLSITMVLDDMARRGLAGYWGPSLKQ